METTDSVEMCACGQPLHYTDPAKQRLIEQLIRIAGPIVTITNSENGRSWRVPRHFIALHGIKMQEMPTTAKIYGFEEIDRKTVYPREKDPKEPSKQE